MATILHVDMDAFFASVELLAHPEWRGRPVIVGAGPHERGVVSTCSYEARAFGVRSAMPSRTAYQRCPHAIFTPPHFEAYERISAQVFEIFRRYTPYVEGVSIDEAFLDVTGSLHLFPGERPAVTIAEELRAAVRAQAHVTCSVGVAPNRLLAKIGSDAHKPDGLTVMPFDPDAIAAYLAPKPLRILWGVGTQIESTLSPYGIRTCGDLQRLPPEELATILGSRESAEALHDYACGRDDSPVQWQPAPEKSVSREHTFPEDESDRARLRQTYLDLVTEVGRRFRTEERWARTARLKVRDAEFHTFTRQSRFAAPARDDITFREQALALFDAVFPPDRTTPKPIRLIGFGVTDLADSPGDGGLALFRDAEDERRQKRERLATALDALRQRGLECGPLT